MNSEQLEAYWLKPFARLRLNRRRRIFAESFEAGDLMLEIGTGTGAMAPGFSSSKCFLVSADSCLDFLKHGLELENLKNDRSLCLDALKLPFGDNVFDGVFGNAVLHHVDAVASLRELLRVLKPGKPIVFSEPNMLNPLVWCIKHFDFLGRRFGEVPGETAFYKNQFLGFAKEAGFDNIEVKTYDFCCAPSFLLPLARLNERILEKTPLRCFGSSHLLRATKPLT